MKSVPLLICLALTIVLPGAPATAGADRHVAIKNFMFAPMTLTIARGTTVT